MKSHKADTAKMFALIKRFFRFEDPINPVLGNLMKRVHGKLQGGGTAMRRGALDPWLCHLMVNGTEVGS